MWRCTIDDSVGVVCNVGISDAVGNCGYDRDANMAILKIRNLDGDVHAQLRVRAAKNGRSMEAEARAILTAVVLGKTEQASPADLQNWVDSLYGEAKPDNVVGQLLAERRAEYNTE